MLLFRKAREKNKNKTHNTAILSQIRPKVHPTNTKHKIQKHRLPKTRRLPRDAVALRLGDTTPARRGEGRPAEVRTVHCRHCWNRFLNPVVVLNEYRASVKVQVMHIYLFDRFRLGMYMVYSIYYVL